MNYSKYFENIEYLQITSFKVICDYDVKCCLFSLYCLDNYVTVA